MKLVLNSFDSFDSLDSNERIDDLGINNLKLIQNKEYFCFGTDSVLLANFVKSRK